MKHLTFLLLLLFSGCVQSPPERFTVELGNPIQEDIKAPVEKPVKQEELVSKDSSDNLEGVDEEELHCMTLALLKESVGEPERGSILVAQVIMNRKESTKFRNSVCSVVKRKLNGRCMFSFWCAEDREVVNDIKQYKRLTQIAYNAILGKYKGTTRATYFKRCDFDSKFFNKLKYLGKIGAHCFYEEHKTSRIK